MKNSIENNALKKFLTAVDQKIGTPTNDITGYDILSMYMSVLYSRNARANATRSVPYSNLADCAQQGYSFLSLHRSVLALRARLRNAQLALSRSVLPSDRAARARNRAILV